MQIFRTKNLAVFYRQLAELLSSGINVIEGMNILASHGAHGRLKSISWNIRQDLSQGVSLGDAFAKYPDMFAEWHVSIIRYSETSGRLAEGLSRMADYLEKDYATLQSIVVGLAYPVALLHIAIFLLPLVKAVTCGPGAYILGLLGLIIPIYGGLFLAYGAYRFFNSAQLKAGWDSFILSIPMIGNILRRIALSKFIRALQCLSASGVPITNSWKIAAVASGNEFIKLAVLRGLPSIEEGQELTQAFSAAQVFPPQMIGMIAAAAKSGSIVQILNTIATYCEKETETAVAVLTGVLPVIVYLLVAGFIGFRIVSFYLGYFSRIFSF